ncbi:hypothetical protein BGW36DRAFT_394027 [Talaromyces proteolyticus]|uniref:AMP-dependent synthetase/ligase domain-containing protein n=1 Tax=Talaromyces proteolyticus TaxID=1131652 RepID=A0AAD4L043_9EURO|nr:uncharacterized protein BGW36DRAFT_394027 [Talaromyces proteolyticus]KAH8703784.1 hypothetical protein BGW36DRAFT_394027 [Talaromyces proteolyticus]
MPKGVVIEHDQLAAAAKQVGQALGFSERPHILQFASYSFDVCILETLFGLAHGCCICVPTELQSRNDIIGFINATNMSYAVFTPSALSAIPLRQTRSLQSHLIGGEEPPLDLLKFYSKYFGIMIAYGPAECTVPSYVYPRDLGTSICNRMWIRDPQNPEQSASVDTIGELIIEGPTVGRGYLNDHARTAEQFDAKYLGFKPSQMIRRYRTGDMARYDANGSIIFSGTKDEQIKLNGRRIELGEIEYWLQTLLPTGERGKVELVRYNQSQAERLVAFICLNASRSHQEPRAECISQYSKDTCDQRARSIQQYLRELLPEYMIPTPYMPVSRSPLTLSSKLDRHKLRELALNLSPDDPKDNMSVLKS